MATSWKGGQLGAALAFVIHWSMRILWLNPLMWPWLLMFEFAWVWIVFWKTALFSLKKTGVFRGAQTKSLDTNKSLPAFIFLATMIVLVGKLLRKIFWFTHQGASSQSGLGERPASEGTDHWMTPPTSPPPFDAGSESDNSLTDGTAVTAPTLRERLRTFRHKISLGASLSWKMAPSLYERGPSWGSRADRADVRMGIDRSLRAYNLFEELKQEYDNARRSFPEESAEREAVMQSIHVRSATRCLELARTNGGIYAKAAQFVASLQGGAGDKGIPKAYVDVLRVMTDAAPYHSFQEMDQVLMKEFGMSGREVFQEIDEVPIAAASLAQVHRAVLKDGMIVAVKMFYPSLRKEIASDFEVFKRLGTQFQPGGFDMSWLVQNFEDSIKSELDCEHEANNCEETARLLSGRVGVKIPKIVWEYTRKDVLCMEYIPSTMSVTEPGVLVANGLPLSECAKVVSDTLTEMTLVHGHVHGDPHAGNIYIVGERRPVGLLRGLTGGGAVRPACVVLDHGLYYSIDTTKREDLCFLYLACIARDGREMERLSRRCAGPIHRVFPLLLSPWFVLGTSLTSEDIQAARQNKLPPSVSSKDVGDAMTAAHAMGSSGSGGDIVAILHSFGYVRGLLTLLECGERARLKSLARFAVLGVAPRELCVEALEKGDDTLPWYWRYQLVKVSVQVDIMAALLQIYSLTIVSEIDTENSLGWCVALAEATLEVGRSPFIRWLLCARTTTPSPSPPPASPSPPGAAGGAARSEVPPGARSGVLSPAGIAQAVRTQVVSREPAGSAGALGTSSLCRGANLSLFQQDQDQSDRVSVTSEGMVSRAESEGYYSERGPGSIPPGHGGRWSSLQSLRSLLPMPTDVAAGAAGPAPGWDRALTGSSLRSEPAGAAGSTEGSARLDRPPRPRNVRHRTLRATNSEAKPWI